MHLLLHLHTLALAASDDGRVSRNDAVAHGSRPAESLAAQHELALLLLLIGRVLDRIGQAFLDTLGQVLQLVQIVAHLLLALQLGGHHSRLQFLLLLIGAGLAGFTRLFEELKAVGDGFFVHADALFKDVKRS